MDNTPMDFPSAMTALISGEKISRVEWHSDDEYAQVRMDEGLKYETLQLHTRGEWHTWLISKADMIATDWFILEVILN